MSKPFTAVEEDARQPAAPQEPLERVDPVMNSLDAPDQEIPHLWSQEAEKRLAAYWRGELKAIPLSEVMAKYRVS